MRSDAVAIAEPARELPSPTAPTCSSSAPGREAILAGRIIDATGDADVADRAGAPTVKTPPEQMQAASVMFHLAGVDTQAFLAGVRADSPDLWRLVGGRVDGADVGQGGRPVLAVPACPVRAGDP